MAAFLGGGATYIMLAMCALAYALLLVSQDQELPVPPGMYYFQPNSTQLLLDEGRRLDEKMMIAAASQKQAAIAAAQALLLGDNTITTTTATATTGSLGVAATVPSDGGPTTAHLSYSRALIVYDLVFEDDDTWLEGVVDRVQLWNKLFLRQRTSRNWRVSLRPTTTTTTTTTTAAAGSEDGEMSARQVKEAAAASAKGFLDAMVEESKQRGSSADDKDGGFSPEELEVLSALFLSNGDPSSSHRSRGFKPFPVHVILAANNGTSTGTHDLEFIHAAMRYKTQLAMPSSKGSTSYSGGDGSTCVDAVFGFFRRPVRDALTVNITHHHPVPVLAVTTGAYVTRAAACTAHILSLPMFDIQSVTYLGTAAVSPVVGGGWHPEAENTTAASRTATTEGMSPAVAALHGSPEFAATRANPDCQGEWSPLAARVALGSVCVTYAALLQECGICIEEDPVASLCSRPQCKLHAYDTMFGPCNFKLSGRDRVFAESMKGAMFGRKFPPVPVAVRVGMERYWAANEAMPKYRALVLDKETSFIDTFASGSDKSGKGSTNRGREEEEGGGVQYELLRDAPAAPTLLNCAEVDITQALLGPRGDALCREYAHALLRHDRDSKDGKDGKELHPRGDLTCVQAMEGFGLLHVLQNSQLAASIPAAIVRAAATYDMLPLRKRLRPVPAQAPRSRAEVLAALKEQRASGVGGGDGNAATDHTHAPAAAGALEESKSIGAASRKLRQLFASKELGAEYVARERLRHNAIDLRQASALLNKGTATEGVAALASDFYHVAWEQDEGFMTAAEYDKFAQDGYRYGIETASAVVLNFFLRDDGSIVGRELVRPR